MDSLEVFVLSGTRNCRLSFVRDSPPPSSDHDMIIQGSKFKLFKLSLTNKKTTTGVVLPGTVE